MHSQANPAGTVGVASGPKLAVKELANSLTLAHAFRPDPEPPLVLVIALEVDAGADAALVVGADALVGIDTAEVLRVVVGQYGAGAGGA